MIDADVDSVNVLMLVRGNERYIWTYLDRHAQQVRQSAGRMAGDPELAFTWVNVAEVCARLHTIGIGK